MYFRKRVFTCSPCSPETGHDIGGYGGSSRKNARERNNERLAQRCARNATGRDKKAGIECRGMDIRKDVCKRRYRDVRNANEMRTVLTTK